MNYSNKVAVTKCGAYNTDRIYDILKGQLSSIGISGADICGKRVVLKPNLLLGYGPEKAATTHPDVVEAAARLMKEYGGGVVIAESPGGIYSEKTLSSIYRTTRIEKAAERAQVSLNYDVSACDMHLPDGKTAKSLSIIKPIYDSEIIVNLCKLKSHSLAGMTCASKNLFGSIPGITKFEMHARFKNPDDFMSMLVDLNVRLREGRRIINICDAVMCMEGDGPSAGKPKFGGLIISSENQFALDLLAAEIIGLSGKVKLLDCAIGRGLCPDSFKKLDIICDGASATDAESIIDDIRIRNFAPPGTKIAKKFDLIPPFLQPRPMIDKSICKGCGVCVRSCPQKTIVLKNRKAHINPDKCIRCYCCQELCEFKAVKIKKSFIYRVFK